MSGFIKIPATEENNFTGRLIPVARIVDVEWSESEEDGKMVVEEVVITLEGRPEPVILEGGDAIAFMAQV